MKKQLLIYSDENEKEPFTDWLLGLDKSIQIRVRTRLNRLILGNPGDHKRLVGSILELRFHFGKGYRIYYGEVDNSYYAVVIKVHRKKMSNEQSAIGNTIWTV